MHGRRCIWLHAAVECHVITNSHSAEAILRQLTMLLPPSPTMLLPPSLNRSHQVFRSLSPSASGETCSTLILCLQQCLVSPSPVAKECALEVLATLQVRGRAGGWGLGCKDGLGIRCDASDAGWLGCGALADVLGPGHPPPAALPRQQHLGSSAQCLHMDACGTTRQVCI